MNPVNKIFRSFLDTILPRACVHCKTILPLYENVLCGSCLNKIDHTTDQTLLTEFTTSFAASGIDGFYSPFLFRQDSEIQSLIHSFKYSGLYGNAKYAGRLLAEEIIGAGLSGTFDILAPVPLHRLKKYSRGYNQSDYICKGMSEILNVPVDISGIKRIKNTKTQTMLNRHERVLNMKDAFTNHRTGRIQGARVLLVDDVKTTGATLIECAKALKAAGAAGVIAATFAIAHH